MPSAVQDDTCGTCVLIIVARYTQEPPPYYEGEGNAHTAKRGKRQQQGETTEQTESGAASQDGGATKTSRTWLSLPHRTEGSPPPEGEARRATLAPTLGRRRKGRTRKEEGQEEDDREECNYR